MGRQVGPGTVLRQWQPGLNQTVTQSHCQIAQAAVTPNSESDLMAIVAPACQAGRDSARESAF